MLWAVRGGVIPHVRYVLFSPAACIFGRPKNAFDCAVSALRSDGSCSSTFRTKFYAYNFFFPFFLTVFKPFADVGYTFFALFALPSYFSNIWISVSTEGRNTFVIN